MTARLLVNDGEACDQIRNLVLQIFHLVLSQKRIIIYRFDFYFFLTTGSL